MPMGINNAAFKVRSDVPRIMYDTDAKESGSGSAGAAWWVEGGEANEGCGESGMRACLAELGFHQDWRRGLLKSRW